MPAATGVIRYGMTRDIGARPRGGAGRRHGRLVAEPADQEQHRLRPEAPVHRHARARSASSPRLVLRLREKPRARRHGASSACDELRRRCAQLLKHMDRALGGTLSAFEVMWHAFYRLVTTPPAKGGAPIAAGLPVLRADRRLRAPIASATAQRFEAALGSGARSRA
ncbi:MAG: hypothetical protein MZV49_09990 [Rhodopseudomonas palustris]|nr:hypothetical protein [Rhodopseudomonas palustris]